MTQTDYNSLPLLLQRYQVLGVLPDLANRTLYAYREDGDLRTFHPDPERPFSYYFKADVGRIHGRLQMEMGWLEALEEWVESGAFCEASGLCRAALDRACASGQLVAVRSQGGGPHRRFWARDLEWFV